MPFITVTKRVTTINDDVNRQFLNKLKKVLFISNHQILFMKPQYLRALDIWDEVREE
jgi:hypothetical protein